MSLAQALDLYGEPAIKLGIDASLCPLDVKVYGNDSCRNGPFHSATLVLVREVENSEPDRCHTRSRKKGGSV